MEYWKTYQHVRTTAEGLEVVCWGMVESMAALTKMIAILGAMTTD